MSFTTQEFDQLIQLLDRNPDLREALRRRIVADDLQRLVDSIGALTESQKRSEARLDTTNQTLQRVADELAGLTQTVRPLSSQVAQMRGTWLENRFAQRAPAYFGRHLRKTQIVPIAEIEEQLDNVLSDEEWDQVVALDAIVRGRTRDQERREIYVAVEVSGAIYPDDVERAQDRAALMRRAGLPTVAVAAGEILGPEAEESRKANRVAIITNGHIEGWSWALTVLDQP